ncbi:S41 family peptidase [Aliidiomarina sp. Khilg15.8]
MFTRSVLATLVALSVTGCLGGGSSGDGSGQVAQCSVIDQNQRLISNLREDYLWNDELPASIDPEAYPDMYQLLADVIPDRDRFSFILTQEQYDDIYVNAVFFGLGFGRRDNPEAGTLQIRYVYDDSPADRAGLTRGSAITRVGDRSVAAWFELISAGEATWDDAFGPNEEGVEVYLEWERPDGVVDDGYLLKEEVETNTVMAVERYQQNDRDVGYFVFDSFINRAAQDINDAFDQMIGVDDLIIDLRYNSGGLIRIANQIASQISWSHVENETFVTYQFNDNYDDQRLLFDLGAGIERLNLDRVFILTTQSSCSASELIINALDPFVEVVTVGSRTCGKPVGQQPTDICDKVIFAINFQTVNAVGFGDYFDGLAPTCSAVDTVTTDWGDPADPLLAEALQYTQTNSCSPAQAALGQPMQQQSGQTSELELDLQPDTDQHPLLEKLKHQH